MDTEVHFDWPEAGRGLPEEWRPLARRKPPRTPKQDPPVDDSLQREHALVRAGRGDKGFLNLQAGSPFS